MARSVVLLLNVLFVLLTPHTFFLGTYPKRASFHGTWEWRSNDSHTTSTSFLNTGKINRDGNVTFINAWTTPKKYWVFCHSRIFFGFWSSKRRQSMKGWRRLGKEPVAVVRRLFLIPNHKPLPSLQKARILQWCALPRDKQSLDCRSCPSS